MTAPDRPIGRITSCTSGVGGLLVEAASQGGPAAPTAEAWEVARAEASSATSPYTHVALWIFLTFSVFYVSLTRGHFESTDEVAVYLQARALWEEGSLAIPPILNAVPGRSGRWYTPYGVGQSVAVLPLYGLGKAVGHALDRMGRNDWTHTFAGPLIEAGDCRWGGDIETFFVNLFNSLITGMLCAVFFAFSLRLGVALGWSFAATTLLGLTSYVAGFSTCFYQHSSEALLLLWGFYLLFSDAQSPNWRSRAWAGVAVGVALLIRFQSVQALPGLALYFLWSLWRRQPCSQLGARLLAGAREIIPFIVPMAVAVVLLVAANYIKFERVTLLGGYADPMHRWDTPLLTGLYAFLLSPGDSILLFTPLLCLAPWFFRVFYPRYPTEAACILIVTASYLASYGTYTFWHGGWCFGPRYLAALVPMLLLPLGRWMEHVGRKVWLAVGPLAIVGLWVQLLHVAVNFSYVFHHEGYASFQPPYGFLFIPRAAPIVAHWEALLAADYRVDMWLVSVYRSFGVERLLVIVLPLLLVLGLCLWRLIYWLRAAQGPPLAAAAFRFVSYRRYAVGLLTIVIMATALAMTTGRSGAAQAEAAARAAQDQSMREGLDALYTQHDPKAAVTSFRKVLEINTSHYGANYQLAAALDATGATDEARVRWEKVLQMAEAANDKPTADTARARLAQTP